MEEKTPQKSSISKKMVEPKTVLPDEANLRVDRWFKRHFPAVSHGQLEKWLRKGQIRVDGKRVDSSDRLISGQTIRIPPQLEHDASFKAPLRGLGSNVSAQRQEKLKSLVLYEDDDVVAINKPAGLAVQGGTGLKENLDEALMVFSKDGVTRPKLVHRLDRETSGVLLIARNNYAAARLTAAFRLRETQKIYWAATLGVPKPRQGRIEIPLVKRGQLMKAPETPDEEREAKDALTLYKVVENVGRKMAFVALWPLTGRTHQLRIHMTKAGAPIWGDPLYGDQQNSPELPFEEMGKGLHLHARRLTIPHPRRGVIDVTAPLGAAMRKTWQLFGFDEKADVSFDDIA